MIRKKVEIVLLALGLKKVKKNEQKKIQLHNEE